MQECGFFNAQLVGEEYDRVYLAEQFAAYFASFIGNGVYGSSMQKLEVISQDVPDMSIQVLSGEAWTNGWWYRNTDNYTLSLQIADGVLSRYDAIVIRWGNAERDMWLEVIQGNPSANPQVPPIRRDLDYYDLMLCYVSIPAGSLKITQAQIFDTRLDNSVCGLVTGVVDQIDTTDLYNQFTAYFEEFKQKHEADFDNWTEEQKQGYLDYIKHQKELYENWTTEQRELYESWIKNQSEEFLQWVINEKFVYDNWTEAQREAYENWYSIHTDLWEQLFDEWFNNIKDKLSSEDIVGSLQSQIDVLEDMRPTVFVASIKHNLDSYVHCDLFETEYACGVQGAGEGPAGGSSLISSPVEYELVDKNNINIKAVRGLGNVSQVINIEENMYSILFENRVKSLVAIIDSNTASKRDMEVLKNEINKVIVEIQQEVYGGVSSITNFSGNNIVETFASGDRRVVTFGPEAIVEKYEQKEAEMVTESKTVFNGDGSIKKEVTSYELGGSIEDK